MSTALLPLKRHSTEFLLKAGPMYCADAWILDISMQHNTCMGPILKVLHYRSSKVNQNRHCNNVQFLPGNVANSAPFCCPGQSRNNTNSAPFCWLLTSSPVEGRVARKGLLHMRMPMVFRSIPPRHENPLRGSSSLPIQSLLLSLPCNREGNLVNCLKGKGPRGT